MRKFIFTTLAAAFFALSASADDGLSVKSFRWKDGDYVGDATKNVPNGKGRLIWEMVIYTKGTLSKESAKDMAF